MTSVLSAEALIDNTLNDVISTQARDDGRAVGVAEGTDSSDGIITKLNFKFIWINYFDIST